MQLQPLADCKKIMKLATTDKNRYHTLEEYSLADSINVQQVIILKC